MRGLIAIICLVIAFFINDGVRAQGHAVVRVPFTSLRSEPRHSSEMLTQTLLGYPMEVLADTTADWLTVRLNDGYEGFINRSAIKLLSPDDYEAGKNAQFVVATSMLPQAFVADDSTILCRIEAGSLLEKHGEKFRLPDGRVGKIEQFSDKPVLPTRTEIIEAACELIGAPYLWGGNTAAALDCSGLVRLCFAKFGLLTPRDASQLFASAPLRPENETPQPGDLLFFSSRPDGPITHVAFYFGDNRYLHCSGEVKISEMTPADEDFSRRVYRGCLDWTPGQIFTRLVP